MVVILFSYGSLIQNQLLKGSKFFQTNRISLYNVSVLCKNHEDLNSNMRKYSILNNTTLSHNQTSFFRYSSSKSTAPPAQEFNKDDIDKLADMIYKSKRVLMITGAGVSTESDIPDYRGPNGAYTTGFKPMTQQQFLASHSNRARYWARSFAGWPQFRSRIPNPAHWATADLLTRNWIQSLVTQNVDGLHLAAGAPREKVLQLHGTLHEVVCLSCGDVQHRDEIQIQMEQNNPTAAAAVAVMSRDASSSSISSNQDPHKIVPGAWRSTSSKTTIVYDETQRLDSRLRTASGSRSHGSLTRNINSNNDRKSGINKEFNPKTFHQEGLDLPPGIDPDSRVKSQGNKELERMKEGGEVQIESERKKMTPKIPIQRPDGDVELQEADTVFTPPLCPKCHHHHHHHHHHHDYHHDYHHPITTAQDVADQNKSCLTASSSSVSLSSLNETFSSSASSKIPSSASPSNPPLNPLVPSTPLSKGVMKPHVVLFGDSLPRERTQRSIDLAENSDLVLIAGSSVAVYSAFRLVERAYRNGAKVVVVNIGWTRADDVAHVKISGLTSSVLTELAEHPKLQGRRSNGGISDGEDAWKIDEAKRGLGEK